MKKTSRKVRAKKTRKTRVPPAVRAWAARNGHKGGKAISKRKSQSSAMNLEKAREKRWPTHFTD